MNYPGIVYITSDGISEKPSAELEGSGYVVHRTDTDTMVSLEIGTGGLNYGVSSNNLADAEGRQWLIYGDHNNIVRIPASDVRILGHNSSIGSAITVNTTTDKSVPNGTTTFTNLLSIDLPAGSWVVECKVRFSANATGYRIANLASDIGPYANVRLPACNGTATDFVWVRLLKLSTTTTYYLSVGQNSGSTLTVPADSAYAHALRIA